MNDAARVQPVSARAFDVARVREGFPALHQEVHGKRLVYLDSAASALKPRAVIDAVSSSYEHEGANIHRAVHVLSQRATQRVEQAREKVRAFLNATHEEEIIFTRGATEAINLVAESWGRTFLQPGDEIVVTRLEHHSNIVPWQMIAARTGAKIVVAEIDDAGAVPLTEFTAKLTSRTKIAAIAHVSNALGTVLPVKEMVAAAHDVGAVVLVDGAQAVPHVDVDVQALGCDFYTFSGHKLYGPNGIGALYGKRDILNAMPPYQGGGDMILSVTFEGTTYNELPFKFEAGTPHIAGAIGLGAAIDYYSSFDRAAMHAHEARLLDYATNELGKIPGLRVVGTAQHKVAAVSFVMDQAHSHDIGTIVDAEGVAIRTGHHCAQPVMERFGVAATARASLGMYNTAQDIDALVDALGRVRELFG